MLTGIYDGSSAHLAWPRPAVAQLGYSLTPYQVDSVLFAFPIVLAYRSRDFLGLDDHNEPKAL